MSGPKDTQQPPFGPPSSERDAPLYDVETTAIRGSLRRRPHLLVVAGTHSVGTMIPVNDGMLLGRALECEIVVGERGVSRKHARFFVADSGEVSIEDAGSRNGILRNDDRTRVVDRTTMREGERFAIGGLTVMLVNVDDRADDLGDTFRRNLLRSAVEDPATKLLSGAALLDAVGRQFRFAERYGTPLAALMIAVEPLDEIRARFGAGGVAFVLRRVAAAISVSMLTSADTFIGLYRDQRLLAILPGTTERNAQATAEWVRANVQDVHIVYDGERIRVTARVGCAASMVSAEELLHACTAALDAQPLDTPAAETPTNGSS